MKFSKAFIVVLIAVFAIPLAAQMGEEHRGRHCSLATLKGTYGSFAQGTFLNKFGPNLPPYPTVAVGLHTFDGKGNWSLAFARSLGGLIIPWGATVAGTYTVTPDCELSVVGSTGVSTTFVGPITGEGSFQEVHITYTDTSQVNSATLRKTPPWGCSNETLEGKYAVFGQGQVSGVAVPIGVGVPIAHVGTFVADGDGNFAGSETVQIGTMPTPQTYTDTYTATYTVNHDCSLVAEITAPSGVVHEVGTITGVGPLQEVHLMNSDPGYGYVFADTWKKK